MSGEFWVGVGSQKLFKHASVRSVFASEFPSNQQLVYGVDVNSGVSEQPLDKISTTQGAINRSRQSLEINEDNTFGVGLEGGVYINAETNEWYVCDIAAVSIDTGVVHTFVGESKSYKLPNDVVYYLKEGWPLSYAMYFYLKDMGKNIPEDQIKENGAVYYLSDGQDDRDKCNKLALKNAMQEMDLFLTNWANELSN